MSLIYIFLTGSVGGILGLCLGFSVITLVEIIYFLTFRLLSRSNRRIEAPKEPSLQEEIKILKKEIEEMKETMRTNRFNHYRNYRLLWKKKVKFEELAHSETDARNQVTLWDAPVFQIVFPLICSSRETQITLPWQPGSTWAIGQQLKRSSDTFIFD